MESAQAFVCPVFDSGTGYKSKFICCVVRATLVWFLLQNTPFDSPPIASTA